MAMDHLLYDRAGELDDLLLEAGLSMVSTGVELKNNYSMTPSSKLASSACNYISRAVSTVRWYNNEQICQ